MRIARRHDLEQRRGFGFGRQRLSDREHRIPRRKLIAQPRVLGFQLGVLVIELIEPIAARAFAVERPAHRDRLACSYR
jgi:hypothetical protein